MMKNLDLSDALAKVHAYVDYMRLIGRTNILLKALILDLPTLHEFKNRVNLRSWAVEINSMVKETFDLHDKRNYKLLCAIYGSTSSASYEEVQKKVNDVLDVGVIRTAEEYELLMQYVDFACQVEPKIKDIEFITKINLILADAEKNGFFKN